MKIPALALIAALAVCAPAFVHGEGGSDCGGHAALPGVRDNTLLDGYGFHGYGYHGHGFHGYGFHAGSRDRYGYGGWDWFGYGLFRSALPLCYSTYWWDSVPFYYSDSNYYLWNPLAGEYEAVNPPSEIVDLANSVLPVVK